MTEPAILEQAQPHYRWQCADCDGWANAHDLARPGDDLQLVAIEGALDHHSETGHEVEVVWIVVRVEAQAPRRRRRKGIRG